MCGCICQSGSYPSVCMFQSSCCLYYIIYSTYASLDLHHTEEIVSTSQHMTSVNDFQKYIEYLETTIFGFTSIETVHESIDESIDSDHSQNIQ